MARSSIAIVLLVLLACASAQAGADRPKDSTITNRKTKKQIDKYNHRAKTHQCVMPLQATYLTSANGCANNQQCANVGDYCQNGNFGGNGNSCTDCIIGAFGIDTQFAFCRGAGALCIEAACPKNGSITIRGRSIGKQCTVASTVDAACGASDDLYLFRGGYDALATSSSTNVLAWDVESVNLTVDCVADDKFSLCEKGGIIDTASVSFTFSSTANTPNKCDEGAISLPCPRDD